jgi:hypothetical protein
MDNEMALERRYRAVAPPRVLFRFQLWHLFVGVSLVGVTLGLGGKALLDIDDWERLTNEDALLREALDDHGCGFVDSYTPPPRWMQHWLGMKPQEFVSSIIVRNKDLSKNTTLTMAIGQSRRLYGIHFVHCRLSHESLAMMLRSSQIRSMQIANCQIDDRSAGVLAKVPSILWR